MAIVRYFGRPTLFITFTANPKWEEITHELLRERRRWRARGRRHACDVSYIIRTIDICKGGKNSAHVERRKDFLIRLPSINKDSLRLSCYNLSAVVGRSVKRPRSPQGDGHAEKFLVPTFVHSTRLRTPHIKHPIPPSSTIVMKISDCLIQLTVCTESHLLIKQNEWLLMAATTLVCRPQLTH